MIEFVSATRDTIDTFNASSGLGRSLRRFSYNPLIGARVAPENTRGLPTIYNGAIDADNDHDILVFVHDDVMIDDFLAAQRIVEGLKTFDVIGLAGNRRRVPMQQSWLFINPMDGKFDDEKYLSGLVGHIKSGNFVVDIFGSAPAACELLDGVLIAARKSVLRKAGVRFDEQFRFHFYDMDFSRTARNAGLRLGTWPIAVTHLSAGNFASPAWREARDLYFEKWGD